MLMANTWAVDYYYFYLFSAQGISDTEGEEKITIIIIIIIKYFAGHNLW